jgi:hypothetical protein
MWELWLKHYGAITVLASFIAALVGHGLIWAYLQLIRMPELFLPSITGNPMIPFVLTIGSLLAMVMGGIMLFVPAIVLWLWENHFQIKLSLMNKSALLLSQIAILILYFLWGGTKFIWLDVVILTLILVAICFVVVRLTIKSNCLEISRYKLVGFTLLSGIFGLYWVFGLLFFFREISIANTDDEFASVIYMWIGLISLAMAPILLQWLLEKNRHLSNMAKGSLVLLCCLLVVAVIIPRQTVSMTMFMAGVRQKPQNAEYYWVDKKYLRGISEKHLDQKSLPDSLKTWGGVAGDDGSVYVFAYSLFLLSEVMVLCPKDDAGNSGFPDERCFQADSKEIRVMPRSFRPDSV